MIMEIFNKKPALLYGIIFSAVVVLDFIYFLATNRVTVVNWAAPTHFLWVLSALILFWLSAILQKRSLWGLLFSIYFLIFIFSWGNQYLRFSPILTSYCMLFNALLASMYLSLRAYKN